MKKNNYQNGIYTATKSRYAIDTRDKTVHGRTQMRAAIRNDNKVSIHKIKYLRKPLLCPTISLELNYDMIFFF